MLKKYLSILVSILLISISLISFAGPYGQPNQENTNKPSVNFTNIHDGDSITSPFKLIFEVNGMKLAKAGEILEGTGHHHLLINQPAISEGLSIPADENHLHFGKGQQETELNLPPGSYTLTLQFANGHHQSYGKDLSKTIQITVK